MTKRLLLAVVVLCLALPVLAADPPAHGDDHGEGHGDDHGRHLAEFVEPTPVAGEGVVPPALWLVGGALLLPWLPRSLRSLVAVGVPAAAFVYVVQLEPGTSVTVPFLEYTLEVVRADRLSVVFGMIFTLVGVVAGTYAWHNDDRRQQVAAMLYNAGAVGVTFAGDYFTLYAFWELMAVSSTVLIWARKKPDHFETSTMTAQPMNPKTDHQPGTFSQKPP